MYLQEVKFQNTRNLTSGHIQLSPLLNIFYGPNGAGKSSILEAIGFITSGRSFRTSKLELMVNSEKIETFVFAVTSQSQAIGLSFNKVSKHKQLKVDGQLMRNLSVLPRILPTQMVSPESYHLIDSGPGERRKFLDWCMFHVEHRFFNVWKNHADALKQRNVLLRKFKYQPESSRNYKAEIEVWDLLLIDTAKVINQLRTNIVKSFSDELNLVIEQFKLSFVEKVELTYFPGHAENYREQLLQSLSRDIAVGYTQHGPHKADLRIKVNGLPAKDFLSRGQKKMLINAFYLAQTYLLKKSKDISSLFIIDDFTSELDNDNQILLLEQLSKQNNVQIILSCLEQDSLKDLETRYNSVNMFHVEHGRISALVPAGRR